MTNTNADAADGLFFRTTFNPGASTCKMQNSHATPVLARGSRPARKRRIGCGKIKANL